ncbi:thiol:disulfide interchange protein DsbA/DsbL [Shewanella sp. WXL01]|uniref:Thiol:disulfide interchange protein n=1 Tax=Shewanella maritima TaxID=2520507 RepID=A0A411PIQ7_9GAMM|nr:MULTISPECIES: thiol:disulfide interchange protein DsbA/DsbL [Shewanella]NKF52220.1 thiol:disulfide interchange protein DsbA/DsbL [Shewanella sp. WXL01]QBF83477.1 thiol:disulfide interchange protein DsbA/DsbL [Shewanella maritima]
MKKVLLVMAALLFAPLAANAAQYEEGVHYTVINNGPGSSKPEITEFFSFYCGHCYNFAKNVIPTIEKTLPKGVKFNQNHVEFIGRDMGIEMSRAFAVAHQLKVEKKIEHALFQAIHDKKQRFVTRDDIRKLFIAYGVDGKDFDAAADSFMVKAQMSKMKRETENAQIRGVPALVVNGKYRVETGAVKSYDELLAIAYYLAENK